MSATVALKIGECIKAKFKAGKTAKDKSFNDGWIQGVVIQTNADGSYDLRWSDQSVSKKVCWKEDLATWVTSRGNIIEAIAPDENASPSRDSSGSTLASEEHLGPGYPSALDKTLALSLESFQHELLQRLACGGVGCKGLDDEEESFDLEAKEHARDHCGQQHSRLHETAIHQAEVHYLQQVQSKWNLWTVGWNTSWSQSQPADVRQENIRVIKEASSKKVVRFADDIDVHPITPIREVFLHELTPKLQTIMAA